MSDLGIVIPPFQPENQPEPEPQLNEFAQGILDKIPEEDRNVVAKYIKEWDGGVTKKFQEIHSEYEPYKNLGPVEELTNAKLYYSMIQNDPQQVIDIIAQAMEESGMSLDDLIEEPEQQNQNYGGLPPEVQTELDELRTMVSSLYETQQEFVTSQTESQQIAMLDKLLEDMHSKHGEFDDEWLLLQLEKGLEPDKAIEAWSSMTEKFGSPRKPAPQLLSGNGAVKPQDQVDISKLSTEERKRYVLSIMAANTET